MKTQNKNSLSQQFMKTNLVMAILVATLGLFCFWLNNTLSAEFAYNDVTEEDLQEIYETLSTRGFLHDWYPFGLPTDSSAEIIDQDYTILATSDGGNPIGYQYTVRGFNEFVGSLDLDVLMYYPYEDDHEMLVMYMPFKDSIIPYQATLIAFFVFVIGLFSIVRALSVFSAKQLIIPIERLSNTVHIIKNGSYGTTLEINAGNDLDILAEDINELSIAIDHEIHLREDLENSRQQLILDISHDLKTPLTNIIGYSESMAASNHMEMQDQKYLEAILRNGHRANHLLNDLFTYSKLNASEYTLDLHDFDLKLILEDFIAGCIPDIEHAQKDFLVDIADEKYPLLLDLQMIRRVLGNLTDNFIRHSGPNTTLSFKLTSSGSYAQIEISDDGIGIPIDQAKTVFETFYRADQSRSTQTGGSGLGLSITKKIIELHEGTIELVSSNKGTHFKLMLPLKIHEYTESPSKDS